MPPRLFVLFIQIALKKKAAYPTNPVLSIYTSVGAGEDVISIPEGIESGEYWVLIVNPSDGSYLAKRTVVIGSVDSPLERVTVDLMSWDSIAAYDDILNCTLEVNVPRGGRVLAIQGTFGNYSSVASSLQAFGDHPNGFYNFYLGRIEGGSSGPDQSVDWTMQFTGDMITPTAEILNEFKAIFNLGVGTCDGGPVTFSVTGITWRDSAGEIREETYNNISFVSFTEAGKEILFP